MNAGIDYGMGRTNINQTTGIRYGVIPAYVVGQAWYDDSEMDFGEPRCPECGGDVIEYDDEIEEAAEEELHRYPKHGCDDYVCPNCYLVLDSSDVYPDEPDFYCYEGGGYVATQDADDSDIFITGSPYFTYAQFCSPCAPGACYLLNPLDEPIEGNKCYCFGLDWFEDGVAPYPIWEVATGQLVYVPDGFAEEIDP